MIRYVVALILSVVITVVAIALHVQNGMQWDNFIYLFVPFCCAMMGFSVVMEWPQSTLPERVGLVLLCGFLSWFIIRIAGAFLAPAPALAALIY